MSTRSNTLKSLQKPKNTIEDLSIILPKCFPLDMRDPVVREVVENIRELLKKKAQQPIDILTQQCNNLLS